MRKPILLILLLLLVAGCGGGGDSPGVTTASEGTPVIPIPTDSNPAAPLPPNPTPPDPNPTPAPSPTPTPTPTPTPAPTPQPTKRQIHLGWNASVTDQVRGYKVYYGYGSRTYINTVIAGNVTDAFIANLDTNRDYYFAVTAYTDTEESGYSNEVLILAP